MVSQKPITYADVGVDVAIEAKAAKILYQASKSTWKNRQGLLGEVIVPRDDFSGLRYVALDHLPKDLVMFGGSDGVATKAMVAEKLHKFDTLAYDLIAMVCDDAVIRGGEPVLLKSVLDVNTLGTDEKRLGYIRQLAVGYKKAAKAAGVAVINGELAQLGETLGDLGEFRLSWSADVTWFAHKERLISGSQVKPGMALVAFHEPGVRSNGLSLLRTVFVNAHGPDWTGVKHGKTTLGMMALQPSIIYTKLMLELTGGLQNTPKATIYGAAHITGGGIPEKLGRMLRPSGHGALLDTPFKPGAILQTAQSAGNITDREAYGTWNMGHGMIVATTEPETVIKIAQKHKIKAQIVGSVVKDQKITVVSQGTENPGKALVFGL